MFLVEVAPRAGRGDPRDATLQREIALLGIGEIAAIRRHQLYLVQGDHSSHGLDALCTRLLSDPLLHDFHVANPPGNWLPAPVPAETWIVDVTLRPGVTDAEGESAQAGAAALGLGDLGVRTGERYLLSGDLDAARVSAIAERALANPLIQLYAIVPPGVDRVYDGGPVWGLGAAVPAARGGATEVPLRDADDETLLAISQRGVLALDLDEMRAIQSHFRQEGRDPADIELETIAQTWSEHCSHKSFRARIDYTDAEGRRATIPGLLRTYIMEPTRRLDRPWVLSAFSDNAGIIAFDDEHEISFKVETHNHPSALEPFGGANTGIGGVVRDIVGVSARPIANTDVLCFGRLDTDPSSLPAGVLHPRRVYQGVVSGIEDYGNKIGVPTVNGAVVFHPGYAATPLVYCGTVGIAPRGSHPHGAAPGHAIVVIGGRTGRDGIHGATFSSIGLTEQTGASLGSAVQIGNPIVEKKVMDVVLQARDQKLYSAITDCGAGGLSSAVGEMAAELGAEVHLERVPLKYSGLEPWEIWISEAQERMVLAVPPRHLDTLLALCAGEDVEATAIGTLTDDGRLRLSFAGQELADLEMQFLHRGRPRRTLAARWAGVKPGTLSLPVRASAVAALKRLLADPNVASKEPIVRVYDHEVQGGTVGKPLVGRHGHGPADAAVLQPLPWSPRGIVIANGINPRLGALDPLQMALAAVDEALRNAVAVGADLETMAILDNFCWGSPTSPETLGQLVRAAQGCSEAAGGFGVPFVSGKDSLNNEYREEGSGVSQAVPPTLLISAIGVIPDVSRTTSSDLKQPGNPLYAVGLVRKEMGGSLHAGIAGYRAGPAPSVDLDLGRTILIAMGTAIREGMVAACHDVSDGGLAVTAVEMAVGGRLGLELDLDSVPREQAAAHDLQVLFGESGSRFLVEVQAGRADDFEHALQACPVARVGVVSAEPRLRVFGLDGQLIIDEAVQDLEEIWRGALEETAYGR